MMLKAVLYPRRQQEHRKIQQEVRLGEGREEAISQECDLASRGGGKAFCDDHGSETEKRRENVSTLRSLHNSDL